MIQLLKNFIPLSDTGSVCYLQENFIDFENPVLLRSRFQDLSEKKIQKLVFLEPQSKEISFDSASALLNKNGFQFFRYNPSSEVQSQIELFESLLDSEAQKNICILYNEISPSLIELATKLVLYVDSNASVEEIYSFFTNQEPDILILNDFKDYIDFLENDPYLITKPDRSEFKKESSKPNLVIGTSPAIADSVSDTMFTLNLNSLKASLPNDKPLLTETESIPFNLNSLMESEFEKEESPEEHYARVKRLGRSEIDDSLSLDVDLSDEIDYISSLEKLSAPTLDNISAINIETEPIKSSLSKSSSSPTIDYKNKEYLDFDAIIEDEIEQGMLSKELGDDIPFPGALDLNEITSGETQSFFTESEDLFHTNSAINLDILDTKATIDLSFPAPLQDLEDILEDDIELEQEKTNLQENPVDPSQTFMIKKINDEIKREFLNEDSKGKIPVSKLTKVDTENTESIQNGTNSTNTKVSIPKITSPKFNPITLDD